ncbi:MAG TPA: cytochrome c3 family protein [Polyangia bacterium]|nr:cytochrome c3 family protein [Polyangia bacterium]
MASLFRPKHNTLAKLSLLIGVGGAVGGIGGLFFYVRSPLARGMQDPIEQPIQFDHRHHTRDEGIDCRFCHSTVDRSPHAGIPSSQLCLNCHSQIWNQSPLLDPLRRSFIEGTPIIWKKVNDVPDFVYFNHSIHVNKGVGCVTYHGRIDQMAAVEKAYPFTMSWCLECHRAPEKNIRPVEEVTNMTWAPEGDPVEAGKQYAELNQVHTRTSCSTCHR